jgi:ABC-type lipoprotein release transport system permease subunit
MIKSLKEKVSFLFVLLVMQGCSMYYLQNRTDKNQAVTIVYKNSDDAKYVDRNLKKGKRVTNIAKECNDSACTLKFELFPKATLTLGGILNIDGFATEPKEERIVFVSGMDRNLPASNDTILYKSGHKMVINKFKQRKYYILLGRKFFIYYFK